MISLLRYLTEILNDIRPSRRLDDNVQIETLQESGMDGWKDGREEGRKADFAREFRTVPV